MRYFKSRDTADDIVQETFLRLCRATTVFASEKHLENWLIKTAANLCKNRIRHLSNHPTAAFDDAAVEALDQRAFDQYSLDEVEKDAREFIGEHLDALPEDLRDIINLRYFDENDTATIAETVGISKRNVYVKLHRARKFLRERIEREGVSHA